MHGERDDEDPDGQDGAMFHGDSMIHSSLSLVSMQFDANAEEDLLAPFTTYTAPPSPARWRKSDTATVWTLLVFKEVAGRELPWFKITARSRNS